jgi:DUF4097 and DUF4098 domain-containing protein YvlB
LKRRELIIEQTSDGLLVRSKQAHTGLWDHLFGSDPKEEVTIKAPKEIALFIKGLNGRLSSGDIAGALEVKGVNGRAELGYVGESAEISGVNGSISVGLSRLGDNGARISGINGGIELKLGSGLNADLNAKGMNGSVRSETSDVTVSRDGNRGRYFATIGSGGAPIDISGINGNVRLTRTQTTTAKAGSSNPVSLESETISSKVKGEKH